MAQNTFGTNLKGKGKTIKWGRRPKPRKRKSSEEEGKGMEGRE